MSKYKEKKIINNKTKRILCNNILNNKGCTYGDKCMYAHNLTEQKIDPIRHKVYTIIKNKTDLKNINLISDPKLFDTFIIQTKVCNGCVKGICPGGYNCREGTIDNKTRICYDDMMYGTCKNTDCNSIHLTNRGLKPYILQKKIFATPTKKNINYLNKSVNCWNKPNKNIYTHKKVNNKKSDDDLNGVILTDKFFMMYLNKNHNNYNTFQELESPDDDTETIIKYLNNDIDIEDEDYESFKKRISKQ